MPSLDEVFHQLRGLWLVVLEPAEGLKQLDLGPSGALRSFWAFVWCLPPILVSWASYRLGYLDGKPEGTATGAGFFLKLGVIELSNWLVPLLAVAGVMLAVGMVRRLSAVIVAFNWMMVPSSWLMSAYSALSILSPADAPSFVLFYLMLGIIVLMAQFLVLNVLLAGQKLLASTLIIANLVTTLYVSWKLQVAFGLV